ncbi:MAG: hypothetical protein ACKV0T_29140 [Planctomycetales bacterium]
MVRGGSWNNNARNTRSSNRNNNTADNRNNNIGFRVCRVSESPESSTTPDAWSAPTRSAGTPGPCQEDDRFVSRYPSGRCLRSIGQATGAGAKAALTDWGW